ncbi:hypothetical protein [Paludisphaera rhizosphaerae]|uniref:hypothetical protein n=1 Tax=Paludisphaera rhizosphaerae TaxID=2711216 RepID=UPI0013EA9012|nr:hypothetical protein [Paludisphaera rhizosphaerae]
MRNTGRRLSWLAYAAAALLTGPLHAGAAETTGIWKLIVLAVGADELAIVDLHRKDGQAEGVLVSGRERLLDKARVENVKLEDGRTSFKLTGGLAMTFDGALATDGPNAGKVFGTVDLGNSIFPARLEKTTEEKLGPAQSGAMNQDYFAARSDRDPKSSIDKLKKLIEKNDHSPVCYAFYEGILQKAQAAEIPVAEVEALLADWRREAAPYGPVWTTEVAKKALTALADQKVYAETALTLGKEIEAGMPADAPAESRVEVLKLLASAAKNSGKPDLAADAESRAAKYDAQIDEEYHTKVPPFKPTPYAGKVGGKPVVFELFTGAQCPPCVAADVAYDGLLKTYKPTEFIGLQYHLHIPGPDPMTTKETLDRAKYYAEDLRGTPSTFINGRSEAGGGGSMAMSEGKYSQYREIVDKLLEEKPAAEIVLDAKRKGDEIAIVAQAKTDAKGQNSSIKLRLALTEESIRYVGGNKLRFHHHVVRALPGGVEGTAIADNAGKLEIKFDLAELRKKTQEYLTEFAETRPFFAAPPALDYKNLSVVAFVQDDHDKSILGAASVPVTEATP